MSNGKEQRPEDKEPSPNVRTEGANREPLTFEALRKANVNRNLESFEECAYWTPSDWATAMAGECGETCNLIKKRRRGDYVTTMEIALELADLVTYADLLARELGIDLGEAVRHKFNLVSQKRASRYTL